MGNTPESQRLRTKAQVMRALGGVLGISRLTGGSYRSIENWNRARTFPSRYFLVMTWKLNALGYEAPPSLWGMVTVPMMYRAAG